MLTVRINSLGNFNRLEIQSLFNRNLLYVRLMVASVRRSKYTTQSENNDGDMMTTRRDWAEKGQEKALSLSQVQSQCGTNSAEIGQSETSSSEKHLIFWHLMLSTLGCSMHFIFSWVRFDLVARLDYLHTLWFRNMFPNVLQSLEDGTKYMIIHNRLSSECIDRKVE